MARHRRTRNATLLRGLLTLEEDLYGPVELALLGADGQANDDRAWSAAKRQRELLERFQKACASCFGVAGDLAKGFAARTTEERTRERVAASAGGRYTEWMHVSSGNEAMTWSFRIFILVVCGELEHFLKGLARWHLNNAQLTRILADKRCPKHVLKAKRRADAIAHIVKLVQPSAGAPSSWPQKLSLVFDVKIPPAVAAALRILVQWRHEYSHRNNPPTEIDWVSGEIDAIESMLTWWFATIALSNHLVASTRRG